MVFTKFSHFAFSQNFRISRKYIREIFAFRIFTKKNVTKFCFVLASFIFANKCEISRKSLRNATENFRLFSHFFAERFVRWKPYSSFYFFIFFSKLQFIFILSFLTYFHIHLYFFYLKLSTRVKGTVDRFK